MHHLKALQTIALLHLTPRHIQHGIDYLGAFRVVTARPIVTGSATTRHKAIGIEESTDAAASNLVETRRLKIAKHRSRHKNFLRTAFVVHAEPLIRQNAVSVEVSASVDVVLLGYRLPKLTRIKNSVNENSRK